MKMESCNWSGRTKAIEELVKGREMANKLKSLLITNNLSSGELHGNNDGGDYKGDDGSSLSLDRLLTHILTSFSNTLCMLNTNKYSNNNNNNNGVVSDSDEVSFPAATTTTTTPRRKSEDSGDSSKCTPPPVVKERRGCYKRRKTAHSWTKETPTLVDDGHAWRKYGQKLILHAEHPRNYFRCTHKYDQGCQATKQVQRLDDEPRLFRTTYYGQHTCIKPLKDSQLRLDDPSYHIDSSKLLCFRTNNNNNVSSTNVKPHPTPTPTPLCDHYNYQIHPSRDRDHDHDHNKHDGFDQSISGVNSSSCTTSTHSLGFEMDHGIGRVEFTDEDVFQFEF